MPAGDLLTSIPWSHEINGYLIGDGEPWEVLDAIGWLGEDVATNVVPFDLVDGGEPGVSTVAPPVITLNLTHVPDEDLTDDEAAAAAITAAFDLKAAFTAGAAVELHAILPGPVHVKCTGVAGGAKEQTVVDIAWGELVMQANFVGVSLVEVVEA